MLKTETNTEKMRRRIVRAFGHRPSSIIATFEHGQWWITRKRDGSQWSVADANTPTGFDFEQVTPGDD